MLREQFLGLSPACSCLVLSGEPPGAGEEPGFAAAVRVVPGIGYDAPGPAAADAPAVARAILAAMEAEWGRPADLLHAHNVLLGKCGALAPALAVLRRRGIAVLVQVHDLAEDCRPHAYRPDVPYPGDCHFAVINTRDRRALLAAGILPEGLHLLANPVRPLAGRGAPAGAGSPPAGADGRLRLLYPVRGIRRKNVGEALLVAHLLEAELTVTLPPRDPGDLERWERWQSFVRSHALPARFGAGLDTGLAQLLGACDAAVSTSLNEGFGFAFLEPWTAGLRVAGRRIAHAVDDFEAAGISLPHLYRRLAVPCSSFDLVGFERRWTAGLLSAYRAYGRAPAPGGAGRAFRSLADSGWIDFGALDEAAQLETMGRVAADGGLLRAVREANPSIAEAGAGLRRAEPRLVSANREVVLSRYGREECSRQLRGAWQAAIDRPVAQRIDREALLDQLFSAERFRILETR